MSADRRIGAMIRQARLDAGLTQAELAEHLGVGQDNVSRIELGKAPLEARMIQPMMGVLNVDVAKMGCIAREGYEPDLQHGHLHWWVVAVLVPGDELTALKRLRGDS